MAIINTTAIPSLSVSEFLISHGLNKQVTSVLYRYAYRAGRRNPGSQGAISAISKALFHARRPIMAAGMGHPSGWPDLGPVYDPHASPPPNAVVSIVADSSTAKESEMSTFHQGTPPKIRPFPPDTDILQGILCELEAAADLVEQLLVHGRDQAILATVTDSLSAMLEVLTAGLDDQNDAMAAEWEREQQARQAEALDEVEALIEANPTLRYLRSEDGDSTL